ncbi:copper chaperone PCu(A)C [Chitiniphilus eburneus]|uniref:Copper chaperone PCu(A)C n=1 Tax=Chitiniphilus eburneus TaxID=2571148 RepID=A0A4U0QC47_9NEIS|nr:copper chaperone PCu(A)C [Chitiniphilus eburneus]TJZ78967.1 copper chaperone PCu(A)C [Chitiniphilus eburneus]
MKKLILGALLALGATLALAHEYQAGNLLIGHPWTRATAPGATVGGVFLTLDNTAGEADKLLSAATPAAERAELHSMSMENGVMKMRQVPAIDVPAKTKQALAPGGLHIMLTGLKQPLKEGASFPLTLTFEHAGAVQVHVKVEALGASAPAGPKH